MLVCVIPVLLVARCYNISASDIFNYMYSA